MDGRKRIAIACQGGGNHTAFTAGALKRLLSDERYEFVALSGTSGGAICAFLAWYAHVGGYGSNPAERAAHLLDSFWGDNSASEPFDGLLNDWVVWVNRLQGSVVVPSVSPYSTLTSFWAQDDTREARGLRQARNADEAPGTHAPHRRRRCPLRPLQGLQQPEGRDLRRYHSRLDRASHPLQGRAYRRRRLLGRPLLPESPVRELPRANPDEIWVIQIDPEKRDEEPTSMADILDRRNELAGNISLYQEIHFIEKINHLVERLGEGSYEKRLLVPGKDGDEDREYRHIEVRWIELTRPLDFASKLDRSPSFIRRMMIDGERSADAFLRRRDRTSVRNP